MHFFFKLLKKKITGYGCGWVLLFTGNAAHAQNHLQKINDSLFTRFAAAPTGSKNTGTYFICQWNKTLLPAFKMIRQLSDNTAIVMRTDSVVQSMDGKLAPANNRWKFSPAAEKSVNSSGSKKYIVTGLDTASLLSTLQSFSGGMHILNLHAASRSAVITCNAAVLEKICAADAVIFIDLLQTAKTEISIIGYDRSFHGVNVLDNSLPGVNGKNIVVGVKEQNMESTDLDLHKRVLPSTIAAASTENHATVIASIIGGAGNSFYDGRGIANACNFFSSSFSNLFADDAAVLQSAGVSVQNHSYGTVVQQFYGAEAVSYDALCWQNKNLAAVFSAGNRGSSFATEGKYANINGFANLTGNFKMAKNIITVAAIDNKGIIAAESSAGPLFDGRLAPQITALGPNGTSDAAAAVSGAAAVLQQVYKDSNSQQLPPASLIKAILYNTATDIFTTGIDYKTGYGLLNSYAAFKTLQNKQYDAGAVANGQSWTKTITLPAQAAQLKITMAYTDTTAAVNNNKALVNDLDLEVTEISSGTVFKPWVLSAAAHADSLAKPAVRKRDSLNTVEQVSIWLPAAGTYQIKVTGTALITAALPFSIAFSVDTLNRFLFTNPQTAADVNREEIETLPVRWNTFVADTNSTGNLSISYNNGASWQLLKAAHKIYTGVYQWPIKDTNSTAVLKMETAFGSFLSKHFIISKVTRPVVDFNCADSFRLSWNKHLYASGYKIFALTDSPFLKQVHIAADTFAVFNRSAFPYLVYAVEPVLSNNLPAIRSLAFDITQQGVQCFYRTLYYSLLDENKLDIIAELSTTAYTDSIFFEQVSASGQLLQTFGAQKTNAANLFYHQLTGTLQPGITYLRARIQLKNGQTVYTAIIQVLTSGSRRILFYPNPAGSTIPIRYILQQGVAADSPLQLFDISGRLVKQYASLPANLTVTGLTPGLYIYKLLSRENTVLETGKLMIQ